MKSVTKLFIGVLLLAACFGVYVVGVIVFGTIVEHNFEDKVSLSQSSKEIQSISDSTFEFISWNVGFFGLGEESDFFYDGGEDVFQSKETVQKNMNGVLSLIKEQSNVDFFLLQEVDSFSWRSQKVNFLDSIAEIKNSFTIHLALNYASSFVPIPLYNPMGPTFSGLFSMSNFKVKEAIRHDLGTASYWPKRLFYLKRCFLTQRIQLEEKELVVVNIHNSAYDQYGEKKQKEMKQLLQFVDAEYKKGNYVVVGGDWNQSPPNYKHKEMPAYFLNTHLSNEDIPKGWKWVADVTTPTNRKLNKPYSKEHSFQTVIDHFLVSPNVQVDSVSVINMHFKYSDHQPVYLKVSLK